MFLLYTKLSAAEVYWDLVADHLLFPTKNLNDLWNNPWLILGMILKKNVSVVMLINWLSLIDWLHLLHEVLGNMCIAIVFLPGCDFINFEINLFFLIKQFFLSF